MVEDENEKSENEDWLGRFPKFIYIILYILSSNLGAIERL